MLDNRKFRNAVEPLLSDRTKKTRQNQASWKRWNVFEGKSLWEIFANAVPNLNIPEFTGNFYKSVTVVSACPIINAVAIYENHPSVTKIMNKRISSIFSSFSFVEQQEIEKIIRNLSEKKACQKSDISLRIIKKYRYFNKVSSFQF